MIADWEVFEKEGFIDECLLRTKAREYISQFIEARVSIMLIMKDLAMESYKFMYHFLKPKLSEEKVTHEVKVANFHDLHGD